MKEMILVNQYATQYDIEEKVRKVVAKNIKWFDPTRKNNAVVIEIIEESEIT